MGLKKDKDSKPILQNNMSIDKKLSIGSIGFPSGKRTPSMESTKSEFTVGADPVALSPEGIVSPEAYGSYLYDCCAFVIFCPKHNKIAMSKGRGKGLWLPFVALKPTDTWQNAAIGGASFILSHGDLQTFAQMNQVPFTNPEPINILRIQLPQILSFVCRITYAVRIAKDTNWQCCQNDKRIQWIPAEDVMQGNIERLWGPEPYLYGEEAMKSQVTNREIVEFSLDDAMIYVPHDPPRNKEEEMLKSAIFTDKDINKLYSDFIQHCFPSHFMSYPSFVDYMSKIGWNSTDIRLHSIFRAFNYRGTGFLSFHELLLGLGAIDQTTQHGGHPGELRCGYIFRYYDMNNDGFLDYNDIYRMTMDIFRGKEVEADESMVEKESKHRMQAMGLKQTDLLPFSTFLQSVGALSFRGTSVLFRSSIATMQQIMLKSCYESIQNFAASPAGILRRKYKGICPACRSKKYKIAVHSVRLDYIGKIIEPRSLLDTEGKDINFKIEDQLTEQLRTYSRETIFNPSSGANSVLDALRQFNTVFFKKIHSSNKPSNQFIDKDKLRDWMSQDRNVLLNTITALCRQAEEIFSMESRCVKVNSPCFVIGDIHGNFSDLMTYERNLWRTGPTVCPASFLFLGDYVDRGEYGVECVAYLFACKILAPDKYFLVRGNHEIRSIQKMFTFYKECNNKYGSRIGPQIWEVINKVFDRMPICAIVDESIYCAHGGIPTSVIKIEDLQKIPTPLIEPEGESPAAWEIMWNDPMDPNEFADLAEFMKIKADNVHGFLSNTKRGTAFYFTEEAVNNFLNVNGLTAIIRGHEVMPSGYKFHMEGKVITVFSCSNYCGGTNESATIYIDQDRLRVIRIETAG